MQIAIIILFILYFLFLALFILVVRKLNEDRRELKAQTLEEIKEVKKTAFERAKSSEESLHFYLDEIEDKLFKLGKCVKLKKQEYYVANYNPTNNKKILFLEESKYGEHKAIYKKEDCFPPLQKWEIKTEPWKNGTKTMVRGLPK